MVFLQVQKSKLWINTLFTHLTSCRQDCQRGSDLLVHLLVRQIPPVDLVIHLAVADKEHSSALLAALTLCVTMRIVCPSRLTCENSFISSSDERESSAPVGSSARIS